MRRSTCFQELGLTYFVSILLSLQVVYALFRFEVFNNGIHYEWKCNFTYVDKNGTIKEETFPTLFSFGKDMQISLEKVYDQGGRIVMYILMLLAMISSFVVLSTCCRSLAELESNLEKISALGFLVALEAEFYVD